MRKLFCFLTCFALLISLTTLCLAAEKISCDLEGENSISYYTRDVIVVLIRVTINGLSNLLMKIELQSIGSG